MMREYLPQFADWIDLTTAGAGDTGDGMQMALDVGGVFYNDPYVITLGSTSRNGSIAGFCMSVNLWGRMVVNSKAQRFFNEGYMPYQATVAAEPHRRRHRVGAGRQQVRGRCAAGRGGGRHRSRQGGHHRRTCPR